MKILLSAAPRRMGLLLLVGISSAIAWAQVRPGKTPPKQKSAEMVPLIEGYTNWQLVNAQPAPMDAAVAAACAPNNGAVRASSFEAVMGSGGPHEKKWINVFVNPIGEDAMMTQKQPRFPEGTVIVKQKLAIPAAKGKSMQPPKPLPGQKPELLTVMIKREAGYNPKNGDWEWMVTDGSGEKVVESGKTEACQQCHQPYAKTDFVVRSYLPVSVIEALKDDAVQANAKP